MHLAGIGVLDDTINPLVGLQYLAGGLPPNAKVKLTVTRPDTSVGSVLARERLGAPVVVGADTIPPRQATLAAIEARISKAVSATRSTPSIFSTISLARDIRSPPACSVIR